MTHISDDKQTQQKITEETLKGSEGGTLLGQWFLNALRNNLLQGSYTTMPDASEVKKINVFYDKETGRAILDAEYKRGNKKSTRSVTYYYDPERARKLIEAKKSKKEKEKPIKAFFTGSPGDPAYKDVSSYYTANAYVRDFKELVEENELDAQIAEAKTKSPYLSKEAIQEAKKSYEYNIGQMKIHKQLLEDNRIWLKSLMKQNEINHNVGILTLFC
ncbi:MAG: hypothetical protein V4691_10770 [Pseudomonadota bacterium]